jgi:hypothetical protein
MIVIIFRNSRRLTGWRNFGIHVLRPAISRRFHAVPLGGAYVLTVFVRVHAPVGDASRHYVFGQGGSIIPKRDERSGAAFRFRIICGGF